MTLTLNPNPQLNIPTFPLGLGPELQPSHITTKNNAFTRSYSIVFFFLFANLYLCIMLVVLGLEFERCPTCFCSKAVHRHRRWKARVVVHPSLASNFPKSPSVHPSTPPWSIIANPSLMRITIVQPRWVHSILSVPPLFRRRAFRP